MSSDKRQQNGLAARVVTVITIGYSLYILIYLGHVFEYFGIYISVVSHRALFLAFLTALTFMTLPLKGKKRQKLPWYELLFIALGIAGPLYMVFTYERLAASRYALGEFLPFEMVLAILTVLSILEITRRVVGMSMSIVTIVFLLHMWFGHQLPGDFYVNPTSLDDAVHYLVYSTEGIYGTIMGVASTLIIMFVIFGQFLQSTPLGHFFINMALALFGRMRGGPAKVGVVGSLLFGTLTGSPNANVAAVGAFTIPMMKSVGYKPNFAGAVESVASSGGQIMPPIMGTTAFLMAQFLNISYWQVAIAALIPALLYYLALFVAVDSEAAKDGLIGLPRDQCPSAIKTLKEGWAALIPLALLIVLLGVFKYAAATAALYAMLVLIVISMLRKRTRLNLAQIIDSLRGTGRSILPAGNACACAGIMVGALMITQFGVRLSDLTIKLAGGNLFILLVLAAALTYLLGTGLPAVPSYIMVVVLLAPALVKFGVPQLAAHMFVFYWVVISFFTPPTATAVFTACGISGGDPWRTGFTAMRISIATYIVAFMLVYRPELLMIKGSPLEIFAVFLVCGMGVTFLAWGLAGFVLARQINWLQRILLIGGGVILFLPDVPSNVIGLVVGGGAFTWTWLMPRLAARRAEKAEKGEYHV